MLPNYHKSWAKTVARIVICATIVALAILAYFLHIHHTLRIPEIVGIILLFLTIVPQVHPLEPPGPAVHPIGGLR
jgi:hypothetical protein